MTLGNSLKNNVLYWKPICSIYHAVYAKKLSEFCLQLIRMNWAKLRLLLINAPKSSTRLVNKNEKFNASFQWKNKEFCYKQTIMLLRSTIHWRFRNYLWLIDRARWSYEGNVPRLSTQGWKWCGCDILIHELFKFLLFKEGRWRQSE